MIDIPKLLKNQLLQHSFVYILSNIIKSAIPFFLLPVLTRLLSPSDYGIIAIFQVILSIFIVFVGINLHGAISVNFFKLTKTEMKSYIGGILTILVFSFLLNFVIFTFMSSSLESVLKIPHNLTLFALIGALFQSFINIVLTLYRMEERPFSYGIFSIANVLFNIFISLFLIIVYHMKWEGRVLGIFISSVVFGFFALFLLKTKDYLSFKIKKKYIKDALFFGIPLIPHALGGWIITSTDRLFINSMIGTTATGLYVVGYQVGNIIELLAYSFNQAWGPFLFKKLEENNYETKIKIVKFNYLYFVGIISLAILLSLFAPLIIKIFVSKSFQESYKYVFWIALGYAFNGMYYMVAGYIFFIKKTHILAWVTFFSAFLNALLNFIFIKLNGAIGAAQATTLTFLLSFLLTWILSYKVYPMPWRIKW